MHIKGLSHPGNNLHIQLEAIINIVFTQDECFLKILKLLGHMLSMYWTQVRLLAPHNFPSVAYSSEGPEYSQGAPGHYHHKD